MKLKFILARLFLEYLYKRLIFFKSILLNSFLAVPYIYKTHIDTFEQANTEALKSSCSKISAMSQVQQYKPISLQKRLIETFWQMEQNQAYLSHWLNPFY